MSKPTDIQPIAATLYFLPVQARVPLKFGAEIMTHVTCARVCVKVQDAHGRVAEGWGETPLGVQWVWPSLLGYEPRLAVLKQFCGLLTEAWGNFGAQGHPLEIGQIFQETILPGLRNTLNRQRGERADPMPWLGALVCCSPFDLAVHDAYGQALGLPIYQTYGPEFLNRDLGDYLTPAAGANFSFKGKYPKDFLVDQPPFKLPAWHLVGGVDPLEPSDLSGAEPNDGYPILLRDWIKRDGLTCLKIKLRGNNAEWDYERVVQVGRIAIETSVLWLTADFNCTVSEPAYVNAILDRLRDEHPRIHGLILYVEQPFPYELEQHRIDVHSVSARKPLFMDESAHDWKLVKLGRELGWSGVALKTCKTQTGAMLSACWAMAHGMTLMVQDLTNPMLAQIPHVLLAAQVGTIMGVETNAPQFYPEASLPEAKVHPGLYQRRHGTVDLSTLNGPGFGYRLKEIKRDLPPPAAVSGK